MAKNTDKTLWYKLVLLHLCFSSTTTFHNMPLKTLQKHYNTKLKK